MLTPGEPPLRDCTWVRWSKIRQRGALCSTHGGSSSQFPPGSTVYQLGVDLLCYRAYRQGNRGDWLMHHEMSPLLYLEPEREKRKRNPAGTSGLGGEIRRGRGYLRTSTSRPGHSNVMTVRKSRCRHWAVGSVVARHEAQTDALERFSQGKCKFSFDAVNV